MKILVQLGFPFTTSENQHQINIGFNWMLEDGTLAGNNSKPISYSAGSSSDSLNKEAIEAVISDINGSGSYTVTGSDQFVLLNSFTIISARV